MRATSPWTTVLWDMDGTIIDASVGIMRRIEITLARFGLNRQIKGMKLAFIGRNVFTWTKYTGFDPEVTAGGDFNFRIDGFRYPNFRTFTGQVELQF